MAVSAEQVADAMYDVVKEYTGRKQYTARELTKMMIDKFSGECDRSLCKEALRLLMESGRCIYTYKGSSYVELPKDDR